MTSEQLLDRVRELRNAGRTPKEIARALKMPPSAVAPLIRSVAAAKGRTREDGLGGFIQQIFSAWDEPAVQVPLELGRQIVYGAIGYARELGFEPHPDFGRAAGYLGAWDEECELTFGRDGKPMYISGPHDDGEK